MPFESVVYGRSYKGTTRMAQVNLITFNDDGTITHDQGAIESNKFSLENDCLRVKAVISADWTVTGINVIVLKEGYYYIDNKGTITEKEYCAEGTTFSCSSSSTTSETNTGLLVAKYN